MPKSEHPKKPKPNISLERFIYNFFLCLSKSRLAKCLDFGCHLGMGHNLNVSAFHCTPFLCFFKEVKNDAIMQKPEKSRSM